jgi:hypothetical protein
MPRVFISYSRWTRPFAERLKTDLERAGAPAWLDLSDLPHGSRWEEEIRRAVLDADHALLLASPEAAESGEVRKELDLVRERGLSWTPLLLAGDEATAPPESRAIQYLDFRQQYWPHLPALLRRLGIDGPAPVSAFDLLGRSGVTQADAFRELRGAAEWTVRGRRFLGVPLRPSAYGGGALVAHEGEPFRVADDLQAMLKFSGRPERAESVAEVLEFLDASGIEPCLLYVTGPRDHRTGETFVANDRPARGADAVHLCHDLLYRLGRGRGVRLFLEAPQTLAFAVAGRLREMVPYRLYQMDYHAPAERRYREVWDSRTA